MKKIVILFFLTLGFLDSAYAVDTSLIRDYFVSGKTSDLSKFDDFKITVYSLICYIGYALAICVLLITGLKFLTANSQQKAQLKEKLWLILLGVLVLAAGGHILQFIADFFAIIANNI